MEEKPKRPRTQPIAAKMAEAETVKDELEFTSCLGSKNARVIEIYAESLNLELWFDKHYLDRSLHGDDSGNKRDINQDIVKVLVFRAIKHLIFYASAIKNFNFLNHYDKEQKLRTIIKDNHSYDKPLSVVCEIHFENFNKYQLTVITAIDSDLRLSNGQHFVEFVDECHSLLRKFENNTYIEVFSCQD
jgi:hypothetical protein